MTETPPPQGGSLVSAAIPTQGPIIEPDAVPDSSGDRAIDNQATVSLSLNPPGDIYLDDRLQDRNQGSATLKVDPGTHTLSFRHPQFPPHVMELTLEPGEDRELNWSFFNNVGFLTVGAKPWADVYIDEVFREQTPITSPMMLPIGEHLVEFRHPQLGIDRRVVNIVPRDTIMLQVSMLPENPR